MPARPIHQNMPFSKSITLHNMAAALPQKQACWATGDALTVGKAVHWPKGNHTPVTLRAVMLQPQEASVAETRL